MRMMHGAALCAAIAIVSAAGCASGRGVIKPGTTPAAVGEAAVTPAAVTKKRMTRIVVSGSSGDCTATIDDYKIIGKKRKRIAWLVEDDSKGCSAGESWHIELEFASEWNNGSDKIVKVKRDEFKSIRIHENTPETSGTPLKYKVYLVYPRFWDTDLRIEVIDPELDIEM